MDKIKYPSKEEIIEFNILVLSLIKVKKADTPKVLSNQNLDLVIKNCEKNEGDSYDKAVTLLKGLVQKHPFSSGNRRTAFITTKYFIKLNKRKFNITDDPTYARVMLGIREGYYSDDEIKNWIKNGKIRKFKR
jgi:death-on-curing protein